MRFNYREAIRDLIGGATDFARFGQAAYVIAKAADRDLRLLAVEGDERRKSFESVIIVRDDSAIRSLDNLVGKSFAFGDKTSTVGRFMPQYFFSKANLNRSLLQRIEYLVRHDRVAYAVADGRTDAGAVSKRVYRDLAANGVPIRSIASFGNVTMPWVAGSRLEPCIAAALTNALLAMQGLEVLGLIKKDCLLHGILGPCGQPRGQLSLGKSGRNQYLAHHDPKQEQDESGREHFTGRRFTDRR